MNHDIFLHFYTFESNAFRSSQLCGQAHAPNASVDTADRIVVLKTECEATVKHEPNAEAAEYDFYRVSCVERTDTPYLLHRMTLERRQMIRQMNRMHNIIVQRDAELADLKSRMLQTERELEQKQKECDEKLRIQAANFRLKSLIKSENDEQMPGTSTGAQTPFGVITSVYGSTKIKIKFDPERAAAEAKATHAKRRAKKARRKQKRQAAKAAASEPAPATSTATSRLSASAAKRIKMEADEFGAGDFEPENCDSSKAPQQRRGRGRSKAILQMRCAPNGRVAKKAGPKLLKKIKKEPAWNPPGRIVASTSSRAHAERTSVRKARSTLTEMCAPEPVDEPVLINDDGETLYEVESIREHRLCGDRVDFRIRWKGYSNEHDEWVEYSKMACGDLLTAYLKEQRLYFDGAGKLQQESDDE